MDMDRSSEQDGRARIEVDQMEDGRSSFDKTDPKPSLTQKKAQQRMMEVEEGGTVEKG
jgi:hypothetical protein